MATFACAKQGSLSAFTNVGRNGLSASSQTAKTGLRISRHPHIRTIVRLHHSTKSPMLPAIAPGAIAIRHASSSSSSAAQSTSSAVTAPDDVLTWDRFFDLRRKRRYINLTSSILTAVGAVGVFGPIIAQQDIDGWAARMSGLDPLIVFGVTTFLVTAGGWLCGPSFGSALFKVWARRRGWDKGIAEKEKSFYARIKRYRADPSSSSPQNPIPDYYGEKIGSVKQYRRWLKDQKAFNLKKNKNML